MKQIELAAGKGIALVDDEDFERLSQFRWWKNHRYATRQNGLGATMFMHRDVLSLGPCSDRKLVVDHINGNGLDNRRTNLRQCSQKENLSRQGPRNAKRFKGVSQLPYNRWLARFQNSYLGTYASEEDAARAVDVAAKIKGNPHWLNFP